MSLGIVVRKHRQADAWALVMTRVRSHRVTLGIVLLACALGQLVIALQRPAYQTWPDTPRYLLVAEHIRTGLRFTDPWRTPGYPTLLALIFAVTGGEHLRAVVLAQAGLIVTATIELYILAYRLTAQRRVATVFGALMGLNPLVVNWQRAIITESLAYALMVTLFLTFERYLRTERTAVFAWFALLSVAVVLTRPQYIYVVAALVLMLAVRSWRRGDLRQRWQSLALVCALAYLPILGYIGANAATSGYVGLSDIANLNLFGKVLEYHMYDMPGAGTSPQLRQFQADVHTYMATQHEELVVNQVWHFVRRHPQYDAQHWAIYGAYSTDLIRRYPVYYLAQSGPDVLEASLAVPQIFAPFFAVPLWLAVLLVCFIWATFLSYLAFPFLLVVTVIRAWRHPERVALVMQLALLLALTGNILLSALTDFTEFGRLRFPLDWGMALVLTIAVIEYLPRMACALATVRASVRTHLRPA